MYEQFARYPLRPVIPGAPSVSELDQEVLRSRPLRELTADELGRYAHKALTTWGEPEDFKHFLPRLLELCAAGDPPAEPSILGGKLALARLEPEERSAVDCFWKGWWRDTLRRYPAPVEVGEVLLGAARADLDVGGMLRLWDAEEGLEGALHRAEFAARCRRSLVDQDIRFTASLGREWSDTPAQGMVLEWLLAPRQREVVEKAFFLTEDPDLAGLLSQGLEVLEHLEWARGLREGGTAGAP